MNVVLHAALVALAGVVTISAVAPQVAQGQPGTTVVESRLAQAIAELEQAAKQRIDAGQLPGLAIAVVFQDRVAYAKGFGRREMGKPEAVDADTVFQLASVSKPIGASVVAALVGEGKIGWDSRIGELDPAFEMYDPWVTRELTIRDLYTHRSGLPGHAGDKLEDLGFDRAQVLHALRHQRPASSLRTRFAYTNFGMTEGAVAAARAYGLSWEEASERGLYQPLGMTSTSSRFSDFQARTNKALNHKRVDGKWVQRYQRNPDAQSPAGGVSSSVNDMTRWMRMEMSGGKFEGKQIVAAAPLAETQFPQTITGVSRATGMPIFYGMGWDVNYDPEGRVRLTHSGGFALGAATRVILVPAEQLGVVILTNGEPIGIAEGLAQTFMDAALYGKSTNDWMALFSQAFKDPAVIGLEKYGDYSRPPAPGVPAMKDDAYVGGYGDNPLVGDIEIIEQGGGLALVIGPQRLTLPLTHYDRDTFTYATVGENAAGPAGVIFSMGAEGKALGLVIENLDREGQGQFKRLERTKN